MINIEIFNDDIAESTNVINVIINNTIQGAFLDADRFFTQVQIRDNDSKCDPYMYNNHYTVIIVQVTYLIQFINLDA